jgi:hypothetical protein
MSERFRVGVTRDFLKPDGTIGFEDTGWSMETIRQLMATSRAANLVPLVRPADQQRSDDHRPDRVA